MFAVAVIDIDATGSHVQGPFHQIAGDSHPVAVDGGRAQGLLKELAGPLRVDAHTDGGQDFQRVCVDLRHLGWSQNRELWPNAVLCVHDASRRTAAAASCLS